MAKEYKRERFDREVREALEQAPAEYWAGLFDACGGVYVRVTPDEIVYSWVTMRVKNDAVLRVLRQAWGVRPAGRRTVKLGGPMSSAFAKAVLPALRNVELRAVVERFVELRRLIENDERDAGALERMHRRRALANEIAALTRPVSGPTWRQAVASAEEGA
jgi:hypothetical protein